MLSYLLILLINLIDVNKIATPNELSQIVQSLESQSLMCLEKQQEIHSYLLSRKDK